MSFTFLVLFLYFYVEFNCNLIFFFKFFLLFENELIYLLKLFFYFVNDLTYETFLFLIQIFYLVYLFFNMEQGQLSVSVICQFCSFLKKIIQNIFFVLVRNLLAFLICYQTRYLCLHIFHLYNLKYFHFFN